MKFRCKKVLSVITSYLSKTLQNKVAGYLSLLARISFVFYPSRSVTLYENEAKYFDCLY